MDGMQAMPGNEMYFSRILRIFAQVQTLDRISREVHRDITVPDTPLDTIQALFMITAATAAGGGEHISDCQSFNCPAFADFAGRSFFHPSIILSDREKSLLF